MRRQKRIGIISMLFLGIALILTGCGGGGGTSDYTIGGTVSGLSGTLALQNNGGDDLTITADGTFTFSTAIADGSHYSVTIKARPVLQDCTVTNGSGTTSGTDVTDVSVNCADKAWTNPTSLSDNISQAGSDAMAPQVAMNNNGNAIIVWMQSVVSGNAGNWQIFKSEYRNNAWTNPSSLTVGSSYDADSPQVAMDDSGNAVITWGQYGSNNNQIFKSEYRNNAWTNPSSLTNSSSDAGSPQVAMDDNGNAVITWSQRDVSNKYQIFKSEYRNNAWTTSSLTVGSSYAADSPQIAMDNYGNAVITWRQRDISSKYQIFKSEYRNNAWINLSSLTNSSSDVGSPQVAMDDNGNAIITWEQSNTSNSQIFKSEYRNDVWTDPSSLKDNISPDGQDAKSPQVAMDDNGNAIITWEQSNTSNSQIFKSEYRNGTWTNPSLNDNINPPGWQNPYKPQVAIAMDDNGNTVITWYQSDGSGGNEQIFKSEYRNGTWTNPSFNDNISLGGQNADSPQVAMDDNGNTVIVWKQYDGNNYQIFKSEYR